MSGKIQRRKVLQFEKELSSFIQCIVACGNLLGPTNILRGMEVACIHTQEKGVLPHIYIFLFLA